MPREVRFITERGGLLDLISRHSSQFADELSIRDPAGSLSRFLVGVAQPLPRPIRLRAGGRVELSEFVKRMRTYWFFRASKDGKQRGLHRGLSNDQLENALINFETSFGANPALAGRALAQEILGEICSNKPGWVETTPDNAIRADGLIALMPEAKVIHVVRDGRDVASSVVGRSWGPNDFVGALRWWGKRMRRAYETLCQVPPENVLTLRLEELAVGDREGCYARLLDFVEVTDESSLRSFFDEFIIERRLHQGRWRGELTGVSSGQFNDLYGQILFSLQRQFGDVAPTQDLQTR